MIRMKQDVFDKYTQELEQQKLTVNTREYVYLHDDYYVSLVNAKHSSNLTIAVIALWKDNTLLTQSIIDADKLTASTMICIVAKLFSSKDKHE